MASREEAAVGWGALLHLLQGMSNELGRPLDLRSRRHAKEQCYHPAAVQAKPALKPIRSPSPRRGAYQLWQQRRIRCVCLPAPPTAATLMVDRFWWGPILDSGIVETSTQHAVEGLQATAGALRCALGAAAGPAGKEL